jgi:hypothetical protein
LGRQSLAEEEPDDEEEQGEREDEPRERGVRLRGNHTSHKLHDDHAFYWWLSVN